MAEGAGEAEVAAGTGLSGPPGRSVSQRAADIWSAAVWLVVALITLYEASRIRSRPGFDPGARFLPVLAAGSLIILAAAQLLSALRSRSAEAIELPSAHAARQIVVVLAALVAFFLAMSIIGFTASTFALFFLLLLLVERQSFLRALGISLLATASIWLLFGLALDMDLPTGLFSLPGIRLR
jgi:hypothetical protein